MSNEYARQAAHYENEFNQSAAQLIGLAAGLVADQVLDDREIRFLQDWLAAHEAIAVQWPGSIIANRIREVLADQVVTEAERQYLMATLEDLIGKKPTTVAAAEHVTELAFDQISDIVFPGSTFCLTGDFLFAPRAECEAAIAARGGLVRSGVSRKTAYLVVGSLGSPEWKHGCFGTKIAKAMDLKSRGATVQIVREELWTAAL